MELISIKCPDCGAALDIEAGRKQAFCTYCGAKVIIDNERDVEYTYRHVDEADIKRAENERIVRLRELELAEKERADEENAKKTKTIISVILAFVGILLMVIGFTVTIGYMRLVALSIVGLIVLLIIPFLWIGKKK